MVLLDNISAIAALVASCIWGRHDDAPGYAGFQLSYAIANNRSFSISGASPLISSSGSTPVIRGVSQNIPRYLPHTSTEAVLNSWKLTILGEHLDEFGYERSNNDQWVVESRIVPNITDKETVLTLARLAANAYVPVPHQGDWSEVNGSDSGNWTHEEPGYGWDDDGLRGYVFTSHNEEMMVLSIKGTSTPVWNDGGPTAPNDKINDNAFFSCCCGRVGRMWTPVCDCFLGNNQCDEQCLDRELVREDRYYSQILDVYANALALVPNAKVVWIVGHSLGGALASMLGRTYSIPAVTFEAPGEALAVKRLHLPVPPGISPWEDYIWHFGHNADPIYMGTCQGSRSTCAMKGYAMETKCHSGHMCMYDTKGDLGWYESVANHRIHVVIDDVLEKYDSPAVCSVPEPCEDCTQWDFIDPMSLDYPSTKTKDRPSTSTSISTVTSTSTTTSTGKVSTPALTRTSSPLPTACEASSCAKRAWYGQCEEWVTYSTEPPSETSCLERNWHGGCNEYTTYPATECP